MEPTPEQEAQLERALKGDQHALVDLLEDLGGLVRARIEPKIGTHLKSSLDVDDVMQVTYMEVVSRLDGFQQGGVRGFLAWLTRMAENNLIDAARMLESQKRPNPRKRVTHASAEESMVALVEAIGATVTTPSRAAARGELGGVLDDALAKLPPAYEKVIRLYDFQGKNAKSVAAEMGKSEGAVYMLRARAHDRLRELLGGESRFFTMA